MPDDVTAQQLPTSGIFRGIVRGDARVIRGSTLEVKGIVGGDLYIERDSSVLVSGIVKGRILNDGARVEMTGLIGG